jgi:hypothetical protein
MLQSISQDQRYNNAVPMCTQDFLRFVLNLLESEFKEEVAFPSLEPALKTPGESLRS